MQESAVAARSLAPRLEKMIGKTSDGNTTMMPAMWESQSACEIPIAWQHDSVHPQHDAALHRAFSHGAKGDITHRSGCFDAYVLLSIRGER